VITYQISKAGANSTTKDGNSSGYKRRAQKRNGNQNSWTTDESLIAILAGIPTALGGGNVGHIGVIMEPTAYSTMTYGITFVDPANPGVYPVGLAGNAAASCTS
jgi:hypothetical protein